MNYNSYLVCSVSSAWPGIGRRDLLPLQWRKVCPFFLDFAGFPSIYLNFHVLVQILSNFYSGKRRPPRVTTDKRRVILNQRWRWDRAEDRRRLQHPPLPSWRSSSRAQRETCDGDSSRGKPPHIPPALPVSFSDSRP